RKKPEMAKKVLVRASDQLIFWIFSNSYSICVDLWVFLEVPNSCHEIISKLFKRKAFTVIQSDFC
ncbi:hypothetical protein, partial [Salinibius halmophilus]|uniref:hypothetical protein n=1 Tax=Salinibius halmophilus TaxID=1853216 RepID=UPI001F3C79AC